MSDARADIETVLECVRVGFVLCDGELVKIERCDECPLRIVTHRQSIAGHEDLMDSMSVPDDAPDASEGSTPRLCESCSSRLAREEEIRRREIYSHGRI